MSLRAVQFCHSERSEESQTATFKTLKHTNHEIK